MSAKGILLFIQYAGKRSIWSEEYLFCVCWVYRIRNVSHTGRNIVRNGLDKSPFSSFLCDNLDTEIWPYSEKSLCFKGNNISTKHFLWNNSKFNHSIWNSPKPNRYCCNLNLNERNYSKFWARYIRISWEFFRISNCLLLAIFRRFSVRLLGIFHERMERREFANILWQAVVTIRQNWSLKPITAYHTHFQQTFIQYGKIFKSLA